MSLETVKILAVDDIQDNLTTLKAVVSDAFPGVRLFTALNGADGIGLALAEDPDVILLDIIMPGMDGFEVCRRLKSDEHTRHIPVVFLTSMKTDRACRIKALETGAEAFLSKPIEEAELTAQIRAMAKIKAASVAQRNEHKRLASLVVERTRELENELTEHRRADQALRVSENKYRELFESASDALFIHDLSGKILDVNRVACKRLGYSRDELRQMTPMDIDAPEYSKLVAERIRKVIAGEKQLFETCHISRNGTRIPTEISSRLIEYDGQKGFLSAARDISERKLLEDTHVFLLQSGYRSSGEDFFVSLARHLSQSLGMGYVHIDRLTGDGLSAQTVGNCLDGTFANIFECALKDSPCGDTVGKPISVIKQGVRNLYPQDALLQEMGAESYIGTTLWSFDGRPIGLISAVGRRPLTDHQAAESLLKLVAVRAAGELERKHAEQERQQLEQQFHHAQKLESLGVLAGGIAHDFNNILTVILGHCYLARVNTNTEQTNQTYFQSIETAANRAADLCQQMLTYAGKSQMVQTQVNLWFLVDEVIKMLQSGIKKNVTIELDLKHDVPEIQGDIGQIQQIIMNLVINAAEAIGEVNGTIRVVLSRILVNEDHLQTDTFGNIIQAGKYACMQVTDTGSGMDEETRTKIFEPFYTTKFTGRGLGMSAIQGIVKSHNGALQLTSTPGVGTTFKVFFPLPDAYNHMLTAATASKPSKKTGGTILLVDDETGVRDTGSNLLKLQGYSVVMAQHGQESLEVFRKKASEIDLILLDLVMPVMGGADAYHELRKIAPAIPIIICSGYGAESVSDIIDNDECAGFMHKPYKPEQLLEVIVNMIG